MIFLLLFVDVSNVFDQLVLVFLSCFQVRKGLPLLVSSMKVFVTLKREGNEAADDAQENRYNIITSMYIKDSNLQ